MRQIIRQPQFSMRPQDVVVLFKIIAYGSDTWQQQHFAKSLKLSQSEISQSVARSKYAGLLDASGKKVMRHAFLEFIRYGLPFVFPQKPGVLVRGIPTAHSAPPLNAFIKSNEAYVWPHAKGLIKGQSILPLYASVPEAIQNDEKLYELLTLTDALRVGHAREKEIAGKELEKRILHGE